MLSHRQLRLPSEPDALPRVLFRLQEEMDWSRLLETVQTHCVSELACSAVRRSPLPGGGECRTALIVFLKEAATVASANPEAPQDAVKKLFDERPKA